MALNSKQQMFWTNEKRKLSDLKPWQRNPRQIKDKQAKLLAESFSDFGQVETIAISANGDIYNGHQRLSVLAGKYGMDYEVDVRVSSRDLTEKERERLTVYLHRGATGEWDFDELANWDMSDLLTWGFEESDFPFDVAPATNEGADAEPQIDKAEELRVKWNVQSGQMWQLGEHRIICGDCTDKAVVDRVMGGEKADLCFTSPPYNLGKNIGISNRSQALKDSGSAYQGGEDDLSGDEYLKLLVGFTQTALSFCQYVFVNVQSLAGNKIAIIDYLYHFKNHFADVAIWHKTNQQPAMAENVMNSSFEYIYFFSGDENPSRAIKTGNFRGTFSNVYTSTINNNEFSDVHGAAFPLDFSLHFIGNFSSANVLIYEPFSGTGTTLIACENLSRKCRAVEISPAYVAVAIQRWVDVTGKEPILLDA